MDSESETGTRLHSAGVLYSLPTTTVYLFTKFASLTCGKERPPRVEIIYWGILLKTASSVNAEFKKKITSRPSSINFRFQFFGSDSASKNSLVHFPLSLVLVRFLYTSTREQKPYKAFSL